MTTYTTPKLLLTLAVPGTAEPFSTSMVNQNFEKIDAFAGTTTAGLSSGVAATNAVSTRVTSLEGTRNTYLNANSTTPGLIPAGTTAQRNAYWGSPGDANARLALQKTGRWSRSDNNVMEAYYALNTDGGTNAGGASVAGWYPMNAGSPSGRIKRSGAALTIPNGSWGNLSTTSLWDASSAQSFVEVPYNNGWVPTYSGWYEVGYNLHGGTGLNNYVVGMTVNLASVTSADQLYGVQVSSGNGAGSIGVSASAFIPVVAGQVIRLFGYGQGASTSITDNQSVGCSWSIKYVTRLTTV